ncbi:MAG: DUF2905 domain-containing protein [Firmicutes bacterium]|jgi:hypothetical protein|nr:DUF2905 domain-containing protein [Bacillota bacterium]
MGSLESIGKILLVTGALIAAGGLAFILFSRLGLGKLPGDIVVRRENFVFYFPIVTTLLISIVLTVVLNIIGRLLRMK